MHTKKPIYFHHFLCVSHGQFRFIGLVYEVFVIVFVKCHIVSITIITTGFGLGVSVDVYLNVHSLRISLNFIYWIHKSCIYSAFQVNDMFSFVCTVSHFSMVQSNVIYGLELTWVWVLYYDLRSVGQSIFGIKHPSEAYDQIFITVRHLAGLLMWRALSDESRIQLLLVPGSAVIFGSESYGTRDHILLSQIRDFTFRHLLRLAGLRWRYSNPPSQGSRIDRYV
jgi:hypothetical protein